MIRNNNKMLHLRFFLILIIVILLINSPECCGYRILGIFPLNVQSHMVMFEQVMKGLARRGHQVDVVSVFPQKKLYPNYTDITISSPMPSFLNSMTYDILNNINDDTVYFCSTVTGNIICEAEMEHPEIQRLIKKPPQDPPYDLVITEVLCANCFMAFGHHLKVPVIGLSSCVMYPWNQDVVANPENLAFVPNNILGYMNNMNFFNRLYNVINTVYNKLYFNYYTSSQTELIRKHFGSHMPSVHELERNLSLILVNTHMSLNGVKPTTPALIEVGGLHIRDDDTEIPAGHKRWLDESKDGFIYFSLGSMITIESFPRHILNNIYKSLSKIDPIRVFMKVPQPELLPPGLPKNIRTFEWIPQLNVLKHKNIRAFITHGGLMGTQEAISCGVPMIGIPLIFDQFLNINRYVNKKIAIRLDSHDLTEANLDIALNGVLYNSVYKKTAEEVAKKFLDRRINPLDEACYWIEYIIRHGHNALRSPAHDFSWWQIALLDVYLTLGIAIIIIILSIIFIIQFLIKKAIRIKSNVINAKKYN